MCYIIIIKRSSRIKGKSLKLIQITCSKYSRNTTILSTTFKSNIIMNNVLHIYIYIYIYIYM